jgi:predicted secreted protein
MAQTSWPWEGINTSETQFSRWAKAIGGGQGVVGVRGDNNLKVVGDSSGMVVTVKISGGSSQAVVRGHMYSNSADTPVTVEASDTSPRIDCLVLLLDPSANSILLTIVKGVPATSPTAPSLTQTDTGVYMFKLSDIRVGANVTTIDSGSVSDARLFGASTLSPVSATAPLNPVIDQIWMF